MRSGLSNSLRFLAAVMAVVICCLSLNFLHSSNAHAAAGTNQQLNFQGRLLDNTGAVVADGSYNMEFKIYQDGDGCVSGGTSPCSGTLKWTEDWIQTNRVTVKNGYFSVNLGSITAFGSNIDWNQDTLWLSTNIGGVTNTPTPTWDGEMTPFKRLASSPYALNSAQLGGLTAANFVQLAQGIQTDSSTVNPSIFIDKTGATADIVELQSSNSDVFTIANNGDITATGKYNTDTVSSSAITFGAASTANINAASGQTLQLGASSAGITLGANTTVASGNTLTANGSVLFENSSDSPTAFQIQSATAANTLLTADTQNNKVIIGDATGTNTDTTQFIVDSSTVDPSSGTDGSIYYNTTEDKFRCYQAGVWADCLGATQNSTLSMLSGLANVTANQTDDPVETLVFTSNTAENDTAGATGFKAAAGGSFRTCLIKNDAAVTAGTLNLRWTVNGSEVGAAACMMSTTNSRSSSSALDAGVVTFSAGDTIGIAFDTSSTYAPVTDDYTVFWTIEYNSTLTDSGATLQSAYNNNNVLTTTDAHDLVVNAADTATDANVLFNLECVSSCGSNGRFAVQNAGTDVFTVSPNSGNITLAPAGGGNVVVTADANSNFQVDYSSTTDDTLDIAHVNILDNANASTGTLYGLAVVNNDNGVNTGVPDALADLRNANAGDTVPDGMLVEQTGAGTLTNAIEVKQSAGTITNGLTFTGTFGSVLKVGSTTVINSSGQIPTSQLTGSVSFASISAATNASALVIGSGGSLATSGSGTIAATSLSSNYVSSITNGTGITGGDGGSNAANLTIGIDQTAGLTWTNSESFSLAAGKSVTISASAAPTADLATITNASQADTTAGANALQINYYGGAANVESAAEDVLLTGGTTAGGTWEGIRVSQSTITTGTTVQDLKLETAAATTTSGTTVINGLNLPTAGAISNTTAGSVTWKGLNVVNPNVTQGAGGSTTATGAALTLGTLTTGGTQYGLSITGSSSNAAGNETAINIGNITAGAATETAISVGSGWDTGLNIADTSTTALVIQNTGATATLFSVDTSTPAVSIGATGTLASNSTVDIANSSANVQTVNIGSASSSSGTTIQGGSNDITLTTATGNSVQIGSATTDANSTILVLDSYNQSTDPAGTNGAMYYNTSTSTFRCYQAGAWTNCLSPWIGLTKAAAQNVTNSATYTNDTDLQFPVTAGTTYVVRFYIVYSGSNATGDYKGEFLFPAAIAAKNVSGTYVTTTTADAIASSAGVLGATTTFPSGGLAMGTAATVADQRVFQGTFTFQPNSSGTMNYQFANSTAAAGRISEDCAGSYIEYQALN